MPWKRVEIKKISAPSKADIVYIAQWVWWTFAVIVLFGVLGWNIFKPKTIIQTIVPKTEEFRTRKGIGARPMYQVSIQEYTYDNQGKIFPHLHECKNFMVIDLKKPLEDDRIKKEIELASGITMVRSTRYRIVIDRPCISADEPQSLWSWEEIWRQVEPPVVEHGK